VVGGLIGEPVGPAPVLDAADLRLVPGLVDLQVNGGYGIDLTSDPAGVWALGARLPETGVTAFLPTVITARPGAVAAALEVLAAGPPPGYCGAVPLGLHCEGPMISRPGTHDPSLFRAATPELVEGWSRERGVAMVTLAPELAGALETAARLRAAGVVVAAGHSEADWEAASAAIDAGITHGTHLFNAMTGTDHRAPGLAAALLASRHTTAGLICDGVHVHPGAVALAWAAMGPDRLALVSDAMAALGMGEGEFGLGGMAVTVADGAARNARGALAGSILSMDRAVRNLVAFTGCSAAEAAIAASTVPARVLGDAQRGVIEEGRRGDLVALDDDLTVVATVVGGEVAYDRRETQ
jgi:N-acetylglucosamine-6-phosphate deacetylase